MDGQSRQSKWRRDEALNETGRIGDILKPMDVLALLVAAIGHDVGHPGLTNAYMVSFGPPLRPFEEHPFPHRVTEKLMS